MQNLSRVCFDVDIDNDGLIKLIFNTNHWKFPKGIVTKKYQKKNRNQFYLAKNTQLTRIDNIWKCIKSQSETKKYQKIQGLLQYKKVEDKEFIRARPVQFDNLKQVDNCDRFMLGLIPFLEKHYLEQHPELPKMYNAPGFKDFRVSYIGSRLDIDEVYAIYKYGGMNLLKHLKGNTISGYKPKFELPLSA